LKPLVRGNALAVWDDSRIVPGALWAQEIDSALATAKVAVLLVNADFLASNFISQAELTKPLAAAREDGATILPVILSPSRFAYPPRWRNSNLSTLLRNR
jgi:hypothetical protein